MSEGGRRRIEASAEAKRILARMKQVRYLRGWSSKELAEKAGVSQATVEHAESNFGNNLRLNTLTKIMAALGISFELNLVENIPVPDEEPPALIEDDEYLQNIAKGIGWLIKTERAKMKIPYAYIERNTNTCRATVKKWERGELTPAVLRFFKLLDMLDLEICVEKRKDKNKDWSKDEDEIN